MLRLVENARRKQLAWVRAIMEETGWSQSELARRAGITHATLSKFFNDADNRQELSTATVGKISAVSPIPHYENARGNVPAGFEEREATPFDPKDDDDDLNRAVDAIRRGRNDIGSWRLNSRAIENIGYLPGDIVVVQFGVMPKDGDVVCAQILDNMGGAETAFRLFKRPYLVAASNAREHLTPTLIDDRVDIKGVVIALLRPRLSALAS